MSRFALYGLTLLALIAAGCAGEELPEDASVGEGRFGLMSVTYEHDWDSPAQSENLLLTTRAQFVRYTAMDGRHVARLLALPLDPTLDLPAAGSCRVYDLTVDLSRDDRTDREDPGHVELLEAGDLHVQTSSGSVTLVPRHFPGLLPFISGVVYGEAQSTEGERLGVVSVAGSGGEAVGPFTAQAMSPALPRLARVGTAGPEAVVEGGVVAVQMGTPLALRWMPSQDPADLTYVEMRYTRDQRDLALRCVGREDGALDIPASTLDEVASASRGKLPLEVARVRRRLFGAVGLDEGELRVTVRERATVQLQQ